MKTIDILGKESSTIILDLNDYEISNILVRSDVSIIDAIKIAKENLEEYIKDYDGVLDYEITGINKGYKYLVVDESENEEHVFRDEESEDTDGISELLWIVDVNVEDVWEGENE